MDVQYLNIIQIIACRLLLIGACEPINLEYNFDMKLSVVMPVFNEKSTLNEIVEKVLAMQIVSELLIVDDHSTDGTRELLKEFVAIDRIRVILKDKNEGKGSAVTLGIRHAKGDVILIQDADLEYNPSDYPALMKPIEDGDVDVVYGSRFLRKPELALYFSSRMANRFLTFVTNLLYGSKLTDMETCYKAFRKEVAAGIDIKAKRFDFEPEFTAKIMKRKFSYTEVPVSFYPRSYEAGKKIGIMDGLEAFWTLVKYRFVD